MYVWIPDTLLALGPSKNTLAVYSWLDLRGGRRGHWYCPQADIAQFAGVSRSSVDRAIRFLKRHGFIAVERTYHNGSTLKYTITFRQNGRHLPSTVTAPSVISDASNGVAPYIDHREQLQITTRRDHGMLERVIRRG